MEQYRRFPALPHKGTRRRTFFLFLPVALPICASLALLTPPNDIAVIVSYDEEERVSYLDDALCQHRRTKQ